MDPALVGREFPATEPYRVGAEKIREFADAIGDDDPYYRDADAARAAGYPDVIAPPTFAVAAVARAQDAVLFSSELGLDFSRVVHGDQRFVYRRPIVAGDVLRCTVVIEAIKNVAGNDMLNLRSDLVDEAGEPVLSAYALLVSRAAS